VDYVKKVGIVIGKDRNLDLIQMAREHDAEDLAELAGTVDYTQMLNVEELVIDDNAEPLRRQAEAFRRCVVDGAPPVVSGADGLAAVRTAEAIVAAIQDFNWDGGPAGRKGLGILEK
jgi:predicted dehydrogenase